MQIATETFHLYNRKRSKKHNRILPKPTDGTRRSRLDKIHALRTPFPELHNRTVGLLPAQEAERLAGPTHPAPDAARPSGATGLLDRIDLPPRRGDEGE
ncbi:hypothetical protein LTR66_013856, partial [Elasticomyces elasticus]